jgi:hypothetical protein
MSSRDPKKQNQKDDTRTGGNVQTKGAAKRSDDAPSRTGGNVQTKGAAKRSAGRKK